MRGGHLYDNSQQTITAEHWRSNRVMEQDQQQQQQQQQQEEAAAKPQVSGRILATDEPVIAFTRRVMSLRPDALSLAQGVVYWTPPPHALAQLSAELAGAGTSGVPVHSYSPIEGLTQLRAALRHKLEQRNSLPGYNVVVTPGANQAFVDTLMVLNDAPHPARAAGDAAGGDGRRGVVLFPPYYFDFLMAMQMTGSACDVVLGGVDPTTLKPSLTWLRDALAGRLRDTGAGAGVDPPRVVVLVNPCNPTGVVLSRAELDELAQVCSEGGAWLIVDNTYEDFLYPDQDQDGSAAGTAASSAAPSSPSPAAAVLPPWYCPSGPHVVHIFSFSKAYGLMGWRVGYIAYPDMDGNDTLGKQIHKTLDCTTICAPVAGQLLALACLGSEGQHYVKERVRSLAGNRRLLQDALSVLGPGAVFGGQGAIYIWARLPPSCGGVHDTQVVEWLVVHAGVCVVPGSAFGVHNHVRCSFANLAPDAFPRAAARLKRGLAHLVQHGMGVPLSPLEDACS